LARRWDYLEIGTIRRHTVGVAGLGEIGTEIAAALKALGAEVIGWKRSPGSSPAVSRVFAGVEEFADFLSRASILVLVLPHTSDTEGLIDAEALRRLPDGCHIVNVGRGSLMDERALLMALDAGRIAHASLDVFVDEPLPADHPFWRHPRVTPTPHIAGPLIPADVVPHFVANWHAFREDGVMRNLVTPQRQY